MRNEKALMRITSTLSKFLAGLFNSLRDTRSFHAIKKNLKPLVPVKLQKHERSFSLLVKSNGRVKPFSICTIKKNKLDESMSNVKVESKSSESMNNISTVQPLNALTEQVQCTNKHR